MTVGACCDDVISWPVVGVAQSRAGRISPIYACAWALRAARSGWHWGAIRAVGVKF